MSRSAGPCVEGYYGIDWKNGGTAGAGGSTPAAPQQPLIIGTNGRDPSIPLMPEGWKMQFMPPQRGGMPPQQPWQSPMMAPMIMYSAQHHERRDPSRGRSTDRSDLYNLQNGNRSRSRSRSSSVTRNMGQTQRSVHMTDNHTLNRSVDFETQVGFRDVGLYFNNAVPVGGVTWETLPYPTPAPINKKWEPPQAVHDASAHPPVATPYLPAPEPEDELGLNKKEKAKIQRSAPASKEATKTAEPEEEELASNKKGKAKVQRSAAPASKEAPKLAEPEEEAPGLIKKEKAKVQRSAPEKKTMLTDTAQQLAHQQVRKTPPGLPQEHLAALHEQHQKSGMMRATENLGSGFVQVQHPRELVKLDVVAKEREIVFYEINYHPRVVESNTLRENVRQAVSHVPRIVEKIITKEVPAPTFISQDKIVERVTVKEVYVDKVVRQEVPVPIEKVVIKEVPVYVDKVVDRVVYKEVFVDKIIRKEVPVEVEKIVYREVEKPVDRIVEIFVDKVFDKIVYEDRIEYHDQFVYNDKTVEVPVDRVNVGDRVNQRQLSNQFISHVSSPPPGLTQEHLAALHEQQQKTVWSATETPGSGFVQLQHSLSSATMYASSGPNDGASTYFNPKTRFTDLTGKVGLGLVLRRNEHQNQIFVKEVVEGFAAHRQGGVLVNDVIISVDGRSVDDLELEQIKHLTVGDQGSSSVLRLLRNGEEITTTLLRIQGSC